jgi:hypothetical protein
MDRIFASGRTLRRKLSSFDTGVFTTHTYTIHSLLLHEHGTYLWNAIARRTCVLLAAFAVVRKHGTDAQPSKHTHGRLQLLRRPQGVLKDLARHACLCSPRAGPAYCCSSLCMVCF